MEAIAAGPPVVADDVHPHRRGQAAVGRAVRRVVPPDGAVPVRRRRLDLHRRAEPGPVGELLHHDRHRRAARRRRRCTRPACASSGPTRSTPRAAPFLASHTAEQAVDALQANRVPASRVLDFAEVLRVRPPARRGTSGRRRDDLAPRRPDAGSRRSGSADVGAARRRRRRSAPTPPTFRAELAAPPAPRAAPAHRPVDGADARVLARVGGPAGRAVARRPRRRRRQGRAPGQPRVRVGTAAARAAWRRGRGASTRPPQIRADVFPDADPGERRWNRMGIFNKMNRNKRSLALDAKAPGGARGARPARSSRPTSLVHNFTPRGARSLGIAPEQLAARNGRIASVAMTGYGETGPMATHSSYGPILEAYGGFDEATGYLDDGPIAPRHRPPRRGRRAARRRTPCSPRCGSASSAAAPVHVDLSQLETLLAFAGEALLATSVTGAAPARHGNRSADHAPQGVYPCAGDDRWVAVTVRGDDEWAAPRRRSSTPALARFADADARRAARRHDEIDAAIATLDAQDRRAIDAAAAAAGGRHPGVPGVRQPRPRRGPAPRAPRGFIVEWDQPDVGRRAFPGFPVRPRWGRFSAAPWPALRSAPAPPRDPQPTNFPKNSSFQFSSKIAGAIAAQLREFPVRRPARPCGPGQ